MVVDDEEDLRAVLRLMLESHGHEVQEAENGAQAIAALRLQSYDLIITDVLMPEEDGIAVAKEVPKLLPNAKVLAISGGGAALPANWSLKVMEMFGVNAALHKPFEEKDLMKVVDDLLAD
jgi:CheY-like chemotaxis protein